MAELSYDAAADVVRGRWSSDGGPAAAEIEIEVDGAAWSRIAGFDAPDGGGIREFHCSLAPVAQPTRSVVAAFAGGELLGRIDVLRRPLRNAHGLAAAEVLATDHHPFSALPWVSLGDAKLGLNGMHLPPEGDPSKLSVEFGDGVAYAVQSGLPSPDYRSHYWYWPNSDFAGFILTVDLAASARDSDPFHFRFVYRSGGNKGAGKRPIDVWLPPNFSSFVGFPADPSLMQRVQTWSNAATSATTGYNAYKTLEALFARSGVLQESNPRILDWGCGHGRIARHFIDASPGARVFGTDVDAENVDWCRTHLGPDRFQLSPLWPPTGFPDAFFDGIFGVSVMTHLTADAQHAWLEELARILRPGGVGLITFQAEGSAAFGSSWRDCAWWDRWNATGFDDGQIDSALEGKISEPTYYRNTTQSRDDVLERWGRFFEVSAIEPAIFGGYQDCAVLRKRAQP